MRWVSEGMDETGWEHNEDRATPCECYPEHCTKSLSCWCEPSIEIIEGEKVIIHNEPN